MRQVNRRATPTVVAAPSPTVRQQKVLELASIGLSDHEIAAHLGVSVRTIRFHLEKVYRLFGVRSRSAALARWRASQNQPHHPADECPYPKPFPDDFSACPAYQANQVVAMDDKRQPVGSLWTCRHLESRMLPGTDNRIYGACRLGDALARHRWAQHAGRERLRAINATLQELAPLTSSFALSFWKLKADQVRAIEREIDPAPATRSLQVRAQRFMGELETFLSRRRGRLGQDQVDIDESLRLARHLIDRIVAPDSSGTWDHRFDLLLRFPWDIWSVLPSGVPEAALRARR